MKPNYISIFIVILLASCSGKNDKSDGYGNFEATEIVVSAEAQGKLLNFAVEDGAELDSGVVVGLIDTTQFYLQKQQTIARREAVASKIKGVIAQINVMKEEKRIVERELSRFEKMLKDGAATQKQYDDLSGRIAVIEKNIAAIETQNSPILSEISAFDAQIMLYDDMITKCAIRNPVKGTVLNKFAERFEISAPGRPLYKIADMENMFLRAYLSGSQIAGIKLGQTVKVIVDDKDGGGRNLEGKIAWVSGKAEFTPKIIQTKEERVNMVYAIKVAVKNDGFLKIGMPGEIVFK